MFQVTKTQRTRLVAATITAMLIVGTAACADDSATNTSGGDTEDTVAAATAQDLLGPENRAAGEPVKIGYVSDGATAAFDNSDEIRAAQASAAFYNEHRGGIGGRPIELVTCETHGDPAVAVDCANQLISSGVVAVAVAPISVFEGLWEPLHQASIPILSITAAGEKFEQDDATFIINNPLSGTALTIAVAQAASADKAAFATIDVPQATGVIESTGATMLSKANMTYELVRVPVGAADTTPQMQQVVSSGAGVATVVGNDTLCISMFKALEAVGYQGAITAVSNCITDATRTAMPGQLEGINVQSYYVIGNADDPSYQLYLAVMDAYGSGVTDIDADTSVGGYATAGALFNALADLTGEITPATALEAIRTMDEAELPAAGGVTFKCGGSAYAAMPAVCTNEYLRTELDAAGKPTAYTIEDSGPYLP